MKREWLIHLRKARGLSQGAIAKSVGISTQYYSYIENGERRPSPENAMKIAISLNFNSHGYNWTQFFENDAIILK